jgi:hypothetical protein
LAYSGQSPYVVAFMAFWCGVSVSRLIYKINIAIAIAVLVFSPVGNANADSLSDSVSICTAYPGQPDCIAIWVLEHERDQNAQKTKPENQQERIAAALHEHACMRTPQGWMCPREYHESTGFEVVPGK